jgi:hypothetical protein
MRKERTHYTAEEKVAILRRHLKGTTPGPTGLEGHESVRDLGAARHQLR